MKKIARKFFKVVAWILLSIVLLLIVLLLLIQVPAVQDFIRKKVVAYLENTIHTKVEIGRLDIGLFHTIELDKIYFEDQHKDTLLSCDSLKVEIAMLQLLRKNVAVSHISIKGLVGNITRLTPDTSFNFYYIIKAFASADTATASPPTKSSLKFTTGDISLENIRLRYADDATGYDILFRLGALYTDLRTFDPFAAIYAAPQLQLRDIDADIRQYTPRFSVYIEEDTTAAKPPNLALKNIGLRNIRLAYRSDTSKMNAQLKLDTLGVLVNKIDLANTAFNIDKIVLDNSQVSVRFEKKFADNSPVNKPTNRAIATEISGSGLSWKADVASVDLTNNSLSYNDDNKVKFKSGLDYAHIMVDSFNLAANKLLLSDTLFKGIVGNLSLKEQSGLRINQLRTAFKYGAKDAFIQDFLLLTAKSRINANLAARYSSPDDLTASPAKVYTEASIDTCRLAVKELLLLAPMLGKYAKGYENNTVSFNGKVKGLIGNLNIDKASLSGIGGTSVAVNGNIKGLPDAEKAFYNINLVKLNTSRKDILGFVPPKSIPSTINLPEFISASGFYHGDTKSFTSKMKLSTSKGAVELSPTINTITKQFEVEALLTNVDAGYIFQQDSLLGNVSLKAYAKGNGFDYRTMTSVMNAELINAEINHHVYAGLLLDATTDHGNATIHSSLVDPDLRYSFSASGDISKTYPQVKLDLLLDTINFHALNLYDDTMGVRAAIHADFPGTNPDSLSGQFFINSLQLYAMGRHLLADSVSVTATNESGMQSFDLQSDFASANWSGIFKLTDVPTALKHTINKFYQADGVKDSIVAAQQWQLLFTLAPSAKSISGFFPELDGSDSIRASVDYNSEADIFQLKLSAPSLHYADQQVEDLQLEAATKNDRLEYSLAATKAGTPTFRLHQPSITGYAGHNSIFSNIILNDEKGEALYHLAATLNKLHSGARLTIDKDSLLLNRNKWDLSEDNFIEYDTAGLMVHNFFVSRDDESIRINSTAEQHNAPLQTTFQNFRLKTISQFISDDSLAIDGLINGSFTITNLKQNPLFTSDIKIDNLEYSHDTVGSVIAQVANIDEKTLRNNITLTGKQNNLQLGGKYFINDQRFEQELSIQELGLHSFVKLSKDQLKNAGGKLKGDITISGKSTKPDINGRLFFDSAFIVPALLGETFTLAKENVNIDNEGIHFKEFTLTDSAGNKARLNGDIVYNNQRNMKFMLDLNADDFRLINANKADNPDLYGKLNIDAAIKVRGDLQKPDINANLRINKQTDLTLVLPDVNPEVQDRQGVVNFVDPQHAVDSSLIVLGDTIPKFQVLAGFKLSTNIQTDTSAAFTLVIDERNGDALKLRGMADLAASVDETGKVGLTGSYELQQGSYQLTLSVLKRKFDIQKGSIITWTGDPMQANINITATYFLKAPTIELMDPTLTGKSEEEKNKYKERLPITVHLKMHGELLKPDISFDITIPEDLQTKWDDVETRLKQLRTNETEMSKQVFALLLLSRFVEEDPMASSAGGTSEGLVRESVSRILSDQLNNLAGSLVKGVDLNVELTSTEDYSTGAKKNQTDLTIGVSKTMLNDRLRVNVGSNFLLEGANANQATSNIAGDIAVDYALSADGRYRIRAYRKNEYEGTVEGQIVESGLTFIITINYDKFKELFQKNKKEDKKQGK